MLLIFLPHLTTTGFRLNIPRLNLLSSPEKRQPGKAPNYSVNWTWGVPNDQLEIVDAMKGKEQVTATPNTTFLIYSFLTWHFCYMHCMVMHHCKFGLHFTVWCLLWHSGEGCKNRDIHIHTYNSSIIDKSFLSCKKNVLWHHNHFSSNVVFPMTLHSIPHLTFWIYCISPFLGRTVYFLQLSVQEFLIVTDGRLLKLKPWTRGIFPFRPC